MAEEEVPWSEDELDGMATPELAFNPASAEPNWQVPPRQIPPAQSLSRVQ
jgi:hypothetical protein